VLATASHAGVCCAGCKAEPIVGARYHCTVCPTVDLCETCEARGAHDQLHALVKLRQPGADVSQFHTGEVAAVEPPAKSA